VAGSARFTTGDLIERWWNNYRGAGHELHGGSSSDTGDRVVDFKLKNLRPATIDGSLGDHALVARMRAPTVRHHQAERDPADPRAC
jgi:hypothetical protein